MPVTAAVVGRSYASARPYQITAAKVAEFAAALGDSQTYAPETGRVPPTMAIILVADAWTQLFADPELGLALSRIVHGDQQFEYLAPLKVGDELHATLTIDQVRVRGTMEILKITVAITRTFEVVATASSTLMHQQAA